MRKPPEMTRRDRQRLADPVTFAAIDATQKEARNRFDVRLFAIAADRKTMLAGWKPGDLTGDEVVRFMVLKAEFECAAIDQKQFAEADLEHRLNLGVGSARVEN